MESVADVHCQLCLLECDENAIEQIACEKLKSTNFVFTFEIMYNGDRDGKVCRSCVDYIMAFYDYAKQVDANQEAITSFEAAVRLEPMSGELSSIEAEPLHKELDANGLYSFPADIHNDDTHGSVLDIEEDFIVSDANATVIDITCNIVPSDAYDEDLEAGIGEKQPDDDKSLVEVPVVGVERIEATAGQYRTLNKRSEASERFPHTTGKTVHNLKKPGKTVHKKGSKAICDKCGKLVNSNSLKNHLNTVHRTGHAQPSTCKLCSKVFNNSETLRSHVRAIHKEAGLMFQCDVCQQMYGNSRSLRVHKAQVHVAWKYCCHICEKQFKRALNFKEHLAVHTGVTLYVCDVCGHRFNSNANMYVHVKRKHPVEWSEKQKLRSAGRRRQE